MRNAELEEAQAGIKIAGRNISNLRYADDTTHMAESEEELKSILINVKEESEKLAYNSLWKKQESSRKTSISALLTMPKPLTVWIHNKLENSEREGNTRPPDLPLEKFVCRSGSNS